MEKLEEGMIKKVFQNARDNIQNMITMEIALRTEYIKEKQEIKVSISEISDIDTSKNDYFSPRSSMKTNNRNELLLKKEQIDDNIKYCDDKLQELQLSIKELEIVEKFAYDSYQKMMQPDKINEALMEMEINNKQSTQLEEKVIDSEGQSYKKEENLKSENEYEEVLENNHESYQDNENSTEINNYTDKSITFSAVKKILESKVHSIHHKIIVLPKLFKTDRRRTDIELEKLSQQIKDLEQYLETLDIDILKQEYIKKESYNMEKNEVQDESLKKEKNEMQDSSRNMKDQIKNNEELEQEQSDMENIEEQTAEEFLSGLVQIYNHSFKECNIDYYIEGKEKPLEENTYILLKKILQTSISNSYKIKKAKEILIKIIFLDNSWKLFILDDGMAYTKEELKYDRVKKQKLNYKTIKKEVENSKGEFKLESIEGEGTTICVLFPYSD